MYVYTQTLPLPCSIVSRHVTNASPPSTQHRTPSARTAMPGLPWKICAHEAMMAGRSWSGGWPGCRQVTAPSAAHSSSIACRSDALNDLYKGVHQGCTRGV